MSNEIVLLIIGGILGFVSSLLVIIIQNRISTNNENRQSLKRQREDAYLQYAKALLSIEFDDNIESYYDPSDAVKATQYWSTYKISEAKLYLYGSATIKNMAQNFSFDLHDSVENHITFPVESRRLEIIDAIRKELQIHQI